MRIRVGTIVVIIFGLLTGGLIIAPSAQAATVSVTGTVSSTNGTVAQGWLEFYTSCAAWETDEPSASESFDNAPYLAELPPGSYKVRIQPDSGTGAVTSWHNAKGTCQDADSITVTGPTTTANLTARPGTKVSGTVSSSNGEVASGDLDFYPSCSAWDDDEPTRSTWFDGGTYEATLPAGTYKVRIDPDDDTYAFASWHNAKGTCASADSITVSGASKTANLVAVAASEVSGTVTAVGSVADGYVQFYRDCDAWENRAETVGEYFSGGRYAVVVPRGTYKVRISPESGFGALTSWHSAKPTCAGADVITIDAKNATANLVAQTGTDVTGAVSSARGAVDGGTVTFVSDCVAYEQGDDPNAESVELDGTAYSITLPAGSYRVLMEPTPGSGALASWHSAKSSCAAATPVTVAGRSITANLTALAGTNVSGSASTRDGLMSSFNVAFYTDCAAWNQGESSAHTWVGQGGYAVTVTPGTYRVHMYGYDWGPDGPVVRFTSWHNAKDACETADTITVANTDLTVNLRGLAAGETPAPPAPPIIPPAPPIIPPAPPAPTPAPPTTRPLPQPSTPSPSAPALKSQTAKAPAARIKKGKKLSLAKKTSQGTSLSWKSTTAKVCSVSRGVVKGKKAGSCKITAMAGAKAGYKSYRGSFTIKIK